MSVSPPRLVTVWCPEWPVVAARVDPDQPAAVFHANRVVARTRAAMTAGVSAGARRRAAQGACPELKVLDHDPDRDAREFEPVVRAVAEMAPRLDVVEPGWLCLTARGPSRYFGGDQLMAERLAAVVGANGVPVGIGVADGRSASAIAARLASRTDSRVLVVPPGETTEFVAPLPVVWLRELGESTPELVELLQRLGLRTFGDLAALDAGDVLARFGNEGLHAHRLAIGGDTRPPAADDPPPEWWVEEPFAEPVVHLDAVVFAAKRMADDLVARLAADGRVCVRLVVAIETEHGERSERAWYRDHGLSAAAMVERTRWQLEGWVAEADGMSSGVVLLRFVPDEIRSDDGVQSRLWGGRSQADHDAARAVVRLSGLAGEQAVTVPAWVGGRLPGDRYRLVPAAGVDLDHPDDRLDRGSQPWPGSMPSPSPTIVSGGVTDGTTGGLIELLDADGRAVRVSGRGDISSAPAAVVIGGRRQHVTAWAGPWPIEQRWWHSGRSRRVARLQLVTDQGVAHLVGLEHRHWHLLATYS